MFRELLARGKKMHPELFTTGFFIGNFSIRKSLRRGETMDTENKNMDTAAIKIIN